MSRKCRDCEVCTQPPSLMTILMGPGCAGCVMLPVHLVLLPFKLLIPPFIRDYLRIRDESQRKCPDCGHNLAQHTLDRQGRRSEDARL